MNWATRRFIDALDDHAITEFNYRYHDVDEARLFVGVRVSSRGQRQEILDKIRRQSMQAVDITDDDSDDDE